MTGLLVGLFYLVVLALVVGCFLYLFFTRDRSPVSTWDPGPASRPKGREFPPPSEDLVMRAEALSGSYRLSDLERIFEQLGAIGAWGLLLELNFTTAAQELIPFIQMFVSRDEVELCTSFLDPSYTDPFRRAVSETGLQALPGGIEGQYWVDVTGTWPVRAGIVRSIIKSIYGVGDSQEVQVSIGY